MELKGIFFFNKKNKWEREIQTVKKRALTVNHTRFLTYYCFMLIVVVEDIYGNIFSKIKKKHFCVILLTMLDL